MWWQVVDTVHKAGFYVSHLQKITYGKRSDFCSVSDITHWFHHFCVNGCDTRFNHVLLLLCILGIILTYRVMMVHTSDQSNICDLMSHNHHFCVLSVVTE